MLCLDWLACIEQLDNERVFLKSSYSQVELSLLFKYANFLNI